ncbi:MAG: hypothetical protein LBU70_08490 [Chitinispirillales bacterium]|jgi:hypothetical protein|nr:hypothetical protein [Chitinispirillales bacterium]
MKRAGFIAAAFVAAFVVAGTASAQSSDMDELNIFVPAFDVRMSMGFNYDLLRSLTDVSFDAPFGYLGLNLPLGIGGNLQNFLGEDVIDNMFDSSGMFRRGSNFRPTAYAQQNDNYTIRVDIPMVGGVGSFAYTQNFFFNLNTLLGGASVIDQYQDIAAFAGESEDVSGYLAVKGALRLPLSIGMGWETMTIGYAYRVRNNDNLVLAFNLHRHLFSMNMTFRADIDLLGHAEVNSTIPLDDPNLPPIDFTFNDEIINYDSRMCNGVMQGRYRAEAWSPSFGARLGRLSIDSRFGLKARARGSARGGFTIPKIIDLETGDSELLDNLDNFADSIARNPAFVFSMIPQDVDSLYYEVGETMYWEMPQAHTIAFDVIPNRFKVSYTKLFGDINLRIEDIQRVRFSDRPESEPGEESESGFLSAEYDTLRVDVGAKIDHIIMLHYSHPVFYVNAGIAGIDFWSRNRHGNVTHAIRDNESLNILRIGDVVMVVPILSGGVNLGTRLQLRLEGSIFPLPAIRSGVIYHF